MSTTSTDRAHCVAKAQCIWNKEMVHWSAQKLESEFVSMLADQIQFNHNCSRMLAGIEAAQKDRYVFLQRSVAMFERRTKKFIKRQAV